MEWVAKRNDCSGNEMFLGIPITKGSHLYTLQTQVQQSTHLVSSETSVDTFIKYTLVGNMLHNIQTDKVSSIVVNMYQDVDCKVLNFVVNILVDKMLLVLMLHKRLTFRG